MRYHCYFCGKSVTSELPTDSIVRAVLVCPECVPAVLRPDVESILSRRANALDDAASGEPIDA